MLQRIQCKNSDATFCPIISLRKTDPDRTCSAVTFFIIFGSIFEIHLYEHDWMKERTGMKCFVPRDQLQMSFFKPLLLGNH